MKCKQIREWIIDTEDGERVSASGRHADVQSHLQSCVSCRTWMNETDRALDALRCFRLVTAPKALRSAFYKRMEVNTSRRQRNPFTRFWLSTACILVLFAAWRVHSKDVTGARLKSELVAHHKAPSDPVRGDTYAAKKDAPPSERALSEVRSTQRKRRSTYEVVRESTWIEEDQPIRKVFLIVPGKNEDRPSIVANPQIAGRVIVTDEMRNERTTCSVSRGPAKVDVNFQTEQMQEHAKQEVSHETSRSNGDRSSHSQLVEHRSHTDLRTTYSQG